MDRTKTARIEKAEYDGKSGVLRIIGKPIPCICPLVKAGRTLADFCNCTLGWQQAAFSAVTGKPVTAEIEESVLRGGQGVAFASPSKDDVYSGESGHRFWSKQATYRSEATLGFHYIPLWPD